MTMQRHLPALVALAALATGCTSPQEWPERGFVMVGGGEALPISCLAGYGQPNGDLPLGCANELNLARMAEDPADLVRPRRSGPAFAAPVAGAAESYLGLGETADPDGSVQTTTPTVERAPVTPSPMPSRS